MFSTLRESNQLLFLNPPGNAIRTAARMRGARMRQADLQSSVAVILGVTARGDQTEIEVMDFTN